MKRLLFLFILFLPLFHFSQTKDSTIVVEQKIVIQVPVNPSNWTAKNNIGFDLSQIAFVNWNAGGVSSITGLAKAAFSRIYAKANFKWGNELLMRYGLNKQDGIEWRKTDDAFQFTSTAGYRKDTLSHWYHSAKFNFNTQFTSGYNYPNTAESISKPFAPAYLFLGIGAEYANKEEKINVYLSPFTVKNTLVLEQRLADLGSFGVHPAVYDLLTGEKVRDGKKYRTEVGILVTSAFKREVFKNINWENRLSLYSDYLNSFGNIDVDWLTQFDFVVNQYVKANLGVHLIYDDDIKTNEEVNGQTVTRGAKIQLKQSLGIGMVYSF